MTYIIAIDGPSGSGKSTISEILAKKLGIEYLNTGLMYRAVTRYFLDKNLTSNSPDQLLKKALDEINISFKNGRIYLNSNDLTDKIRADEVTENVSWVSAKSYVREKLVDIQRQIAGHTSFILDGRDIGSVVFPDAKYKFFLTASPLVRAKRRYDQEESDLSLEDIEKSIIKRDNFDSTRKISPLKKPKSAITIDSSDLTIEETINKILSFMEKDDVL